MKVSLEVIVAMCDILFNLSLILEQENKHNAK